jgi:hypothetical protein
MPSLTYSKVLPVAQAVSVSATVTIKTFFTELPSLNVISLTKLKHIWKFVQWEFKKLRQIGTGFIVSTDKYKYLAEAYAVRDDPT